MVETILHTLGLCGETHPKLLDLFPFLSYISEYRTALAYTLKNTWQNLI
jgi:hypothetical protein